MAFELKFCVDENIFSLVPSTSGFRGKSVLDVGNADFPNKMLVQNDLASDQLMPHLIFNKVKNISRSHFVDF